LRETPKASFYQVEVETHSMVELIALSKVKNDEDDPMDNPQPSPKRDIL
jgi:hypothetical protein